ncbi:MAG: WG repeat-containing protein [Candidatus Brocadiia bacterium]
MTSRGSMFRRLLAAALGAAALLVLLAFTEGDLARLAGPVPFATVTLSGDGGKWVVINRKGERQGTGAFVYAGGFSEGLAAVCDGTAWGYVDTKGKIVIPCKFSRAGEFHEGFAPVRVGGRSLIGGEAEWDNSAFKYDVSPEVAGNWRYIMKSGKYAFEGEFDYAWEFRDGQGEVVKSGENLYVRPDGTLDDERYYEEPPEEPEEADAKVCPYYASKDFRGLYGYQVAGKWVIEPQFQNAMNFEEGMAAVEDDGKWGFIDLEGIVRIEMEYDDVWSFNEGYAPAELDGKWTFLRKDGSHLTDVEYDEVSDFEHGRAVVAVGGKYGVIDGDGTYIIPMIYDHLLLDVAQPVGWITVGKKTGLISLDGKVICEPLFDDYEQFEGSCAAVELDGEWNFINTRAEPQFDVPLESVDTRNDYAIVSRGGRSGCFNLVTCAKSELIYDDFEPLWDGPMLLALKNGNQVVLSPDTCKELTPEFDEIGMCRDDMWTYEFNGLWGILDSSWKVIVKPEYLEIRDFVNGLAAVRSLAGWGFVDEKGIAVVAPGFAGVLDWSGEAAMARLGCDGRAALVEGSGFVLRGTFDEVGEFKVGLAPARQSGKWGFIDTSGRIRIPMQFDFAGSFSLGLAPVCLGGKWGYVNCSGAQVIPIVYDYAEPFSEGYGVVTKDGQWLFLDVSGATAFRPFDYPVSGFQEGFAWISDAFDAWKRMDTHGVFHSGGSPGYNTDVDPQSLECILNPLAGVEYSSLLPLSENLRGIVWRRPIKGIRDIEGRITCLPQFEDVYSYSEGLLLAEVGHRRKFLRLDGSVALEPSEGMYFASPFYEGLAEVFLDKRASYIDRSGRIAFDKWFQDAGSFHEGLARVTIDNQCGFIDKSGAIVISPRYKTARDFYAGLAIVETPNGYTAVDKSGIEQFPPIPWDIHDFEGEYSCAWQDDSFHIINRKGEVLDRKLADLDAPDAPAVNIGDGIDAEIMWLYGEIALVQSLAGLPDFVFNIRTGRMRKVGISPWPMVSTVAGRISAKAPGASGRFGVLDTDLNWVVPPEYDEVGPFSEGLAFARRGERRGYIDVTGRWAIEFDRGRGAPFRYGVARIDDNTDGTWWINRQGKRATLADATCEAGRYEVFEGGRAGFLDSEGCLVIYPSFLDIHSFSQHLAAAMDEKSLWGFINPSGDYVIRPQFAEVGDFTEGFAAVMAKVGQDFLWTFIDKTGNQIHEPYFDEVRPFHQGLAAVRRGALWGYMDKHGWMVFPLQFDAAGDFMLEEAK